MFNNEISKTRNTRHTVLIILLFVIPAAGVIFLSWKDIYSPIPAFSELQEAIVNEFRHEIARETYSHSQYSIEFYDRAGRRYQTRGMSKPALENITSALASGAPVVIRYGRWSSPFPSATIFTVYQIEIGKHVVIPYTDLAGAKRREQSAGPFIIICTILVACIVIFIALWRQRKFEQKLAPKNTEIEK